MNTDTTKDLHQSLGRVEGKIDFLISSQSSLVDRVDRLADAQAKHGERLTALESRGASLHRYVAIAIATIAAIAAFWGNVVRDHIHI